MDRPTWPETFGEICGIILKRSTCVKYQTSAVIVKDSQIIALGYNGTASKSVECRQYWKDYWRTYIYDENSTFEDWIKTQHFKDLHSKWSIINELHAEMNALKWVTKKDIDDSCVMYSYLSPCEQCAKHILSYGLKTLYYSVEYNGKVKGTVCGLDYLRANGVACIKL
jgi:dCMP deaminase